MTGRRITEARGPIDACIDAPPSKSLTHRCLVAAALAEGRSEVVDPLDADDGRATRDGLVRLGIEITDGPGAWIVDGRGGFVPGGGTLDLGESGTTARLLMAVAALGQRPSTLDGAPRLRERPMHELARAIEALGGVVRLAETPGGLPAECGGAPPAGGAIRVPSDRSSQFASALLLIAPQLPAGLDLRLEPPIVSRPYIELTVEVLEAFGVPVLRPDPLSYRVAATTYPGREIRVDGDHSSASYALAAAAVLGGRVRVDGLRPDSAQADAAFGGMLERLGCDVRRGESWIEVRGDGSIPAFELDLGDCPDLAPTVAVLGLFADGPSRIDGVAHLRIKESDRLAVLAENLVALGRTASAGESSLEIGPPAALTGATIRTASDHRMAMAFAIAGLRLPGVAIDDPACVAKSNPSFWEQLDRLRG